MHRIIEMIRILWDFQYLVAQLSKEGTLQRPGFWRIIATENSLIGDQWGCHETCSLSPAQVRAQRWMLAQLQQCEVHGAPQQCQLHLHTSCWPGPTATITHQQRSQGKVQTKFFVLFNTIAVSLCNSGRFLFFPPFSQTNKKTTRI